MMRNWIIGIGLVTALFAHQTHAQLGGDSNAPLKITADRSLEWDRDQQIFTANDNAVATRGNVSLRSDKLTAFYKPGPDGGQEDVQITQILAQGAVRISSPDGDVYGDEAAYDVATQAMVMTGNNLRMVAPEQTVTARDKFEYFVQGGELYAHGNATILSGENRLRANQLKAIFTEQDGEDRALETIEARGNVVITTPDETLTGPYAIYRAGPNTAEITGGVRITRGPNTLQGERAEVDLTTNISTMFGGGPGGRVEGVFFPGTQDSTAGE